MSTITDTTKGAVPKKFKSKKLLIYNPNRVAHTLDQLGLGYFSPIARLVGGDEPKKQLREIVSNTFLPLLAFAVFIGIWGICSQFVVSDSTRIPSPAQTWTAWQGMVDFAEAEKIKEIEYYEANEERALKMEAKAKVAEEAGQTDRVERYNGMAEKFRSKVYQGATTFFDQIGISLITVAVGFLVATLLGVPIGILCGVSKRVNIALNPIIQLFKPVSPLAWFPIVFVFTTWGIEQPESTSIWQRALWTSAGVVTLCSIWPTLINTAVGVASVDKDHLNVAKVLKLGWFKRIWKIVLPSSLPLIFTGLRLSIGVGWMVLVASDMMAQNQGLGKFVWDMYQNGDTQSTAQIIIAVFFIGAIGFLLDRIMLVCQRLVTFEEQNI
ncbi:MAG: nitrate ABC transporter permease [Verrucomicrobiales bacterium]|nr:nitrate ABC transporter permease [Verrucomicrobiales bacterium]